MVLIDTTRRRYTQGGSVYSRPPPEKCGHSLLLACDVGGCPYTTRRPDHMKLQKKRHRGERLFPPCDTCPYYRAFTKTDLTSHKWTHSHEKKPFVCDFDGWLRVRILSVGESSKAQENPHHRRPTLSQEARETSIQAAQGVGLHCRL